MIELVKPNGKIVQTTKEQVDAFLAMGYKLAGEPEPQDNSDLIREIQCAINELPKARFSKKTGKPGVKALEEVLGFDITEAERDLAWQNLQES